MTDNYKVGSSITRLSLLTELEEYIENNLMTYSKNYLMLEPKDGFEVEWESELQKSKLINEMITEEKNKVKLDKDVNERESL